MPRRKQPANIMDAQKVAGEGEENSDSLVFQPAETSVDEAVAAMESADEAQLLDLIKGMQAEIAALRAETATNTERTLRSYDQTDDKLFIAKPNAQKWTERRVVDKKPVIIDFVATGFIGPFDSQDQVDVYLEKKRSGRDGENAVYWDNITIMSGREAREKRDDEKAQRESQFGGSTSIHALDQKIFQQNHTVSGNPGVGQALASNDNAGPAPYAP